MCCLASRARMADACTIHYFHAGGATVQEEVLVRKIMDGDSTSS
jgi:hypothetical protein